MSSHSRFVPVLVATAAAVAFAGCGGSSSSSPSAAVPAAAAQASTTTTSNTASTTAGPVMVASPADGSLVYDPKQLTAAAGTLRITYDNPSPVPHNIVLQDASGKTVGSKITPFANGSRALTATVKAGVYTYYCSVPGHREAGMVGTLKVQ